MLGIPVLLLAMIAVSHRTGNQALSFTTSNPFANGQALYPSGYNTPTASVDLKAEIRVTEGKDQTQLAVARRLETQQSAATGASITQLGTIPNPVTLENAKKGAQALKAAESASTTNLQSDGNPLQTNFFPMDSNYRMIKKALYTTIFLYIVLQVLACMCVKKRVRYTEKFQQFSQKAEAQELEEQA